MVEPSQAAPRVLVLYTETAPYVMACLDALVARTGVRIELVRWPVNAEAPFDTGAHQGITIHDRSAFDDQALLAFALKFDPQLVIASGWVGSFAARPKTTLPREISRKMPALPRAQQRRKMPPLLRGDGTDNGSAGDTSGR